MDTYVLLYTPLNHFNWNRIDTKQCIRGFSLWMCLLSISVFVYFFSEHATEWICMKGLDDSNFLQTFWVLTFNAIKAMLLFLQEPAPGTLEELWPTISSRALFTPPENWFLIVQELQVCSYNADHNTPNTVFQVPCLNLKLQTILFFNDSRLVVLLD